MKHRLNSMNIYQASSKYRMLFYVLDYKNKRLPWPEGAGVAALSSTLEGGSSVSGQGTDLGCRFEPWSGHLWGDGSRSMFLSHVSFFLYLPSSLSLKSMNVSSGKDFLKSD